MSNGAAFQYEIVEHIATLSESNGTTKELNLRGEGFQWRRYRRFRAGRKNAY